MILEEKAMRKDTNGNTYFQTVAKYDANLDGDRLTVNGHYLPIVHKYGWAYKVTDTKILTGYTPQEFWRQFFEDEFWRFHMVNICRHIVEHGKAIA